MTMQRAATRSAALLMLWLILISDRSIVQPVVAQNDLTTNFLSGLLSLINEIPDMTPPKSTSTVEGKPSDSKNAESTIMSETLTSLAVPTTTTTQRTTTTTTTTTSTTTAKPQVDTEEISQQEAPLPLRVCPGSCMLASFVRYCEAVLEVDSLCDSKTRCCVTRELFGDSPPAQLRIYDHKKFGEPVVPNEVVVGGPSTPLATTSTTTTSTTEPQTLSTNANTNTTRKRCRGGCVNIYIANFLCEKVDSDADCGDMSLCCVEDEEEEEESQKQEVITTTTTQRPAKTSTTSQTGQNKRPSCSGICLPNIVSILCEKKSGIGCSKDQSCCETLRNLPLPKITPAKAKPATKPPVRREDRVDPTPDPTPDPRPNCPGSCIKAYLSLACFKNAEITDLFKCPRAEQRCCAYKSVIREMQGIKETPTNEIKDKIDYELAPLLPGHYPRVPVTPQAIPHDHGPIYVDAPIRSTTKKAPYDWLVCGAKGTQRSQYSLTEDGGGGGELRRREARIIGGQDADYNEWCWQVAILNSRNQYLCGGALIGKRWVITSAHCVTETVKSGEAVYATLGDSDLSRRYGNPGARTIQVDTTYIHHNHNSQTLDNDIALLRLERDVELGQGVCLVCLPGRESDHRPGTRCTVTGYGYPSQEGPIALRIRSADVPIVSDSECIRKINAITQKVFIMPTNSFCAGGESYNDACRGDGGSPLVCKQGDFYELAGLVSWAYGCGQGPGVYVKILPFIDWIKQITVLNS
ncbi:hypothetical protein TKK_0012868 [Trichogramma kaykai]